jgi:hypothetical protein
VADGECVTTRDTGTLTIWARDTPTLFCRPMPPFERADDDDDDADDVAVDGPNENETDDAEGEVGAMLCS